MENDLLHKALATWMDLCVEIKGTDADTDARIEQRFAKFYFPFRLQCSLVAEPGAPPGSNC